MKKALTIVPPAKYNMILQSITEADLEHLRIWKNEHRTSFFYKEIISPNQQVLWYQNYASRENDYIFIIKDLTGLSIGCLGFRLLDNKIDLYNIIRGNKTAKNVYMKDAMHIMLNFIEQHYKHPIQCDVLKDNPAVKWYQKCGFAISEENEYYIMYISPSQIPTIEVTIKEELL